MSEQLASRSSLADTLLFALAEALAQNRIDIAESLLYTLDQVDHAHRDVGALLYLRHDLHCGSRILATTRQRPLQRTGR